MPKAKVVFYREENGTVLALDWFDGLPDKVKVKCLVRIERLRDLGHELRRPETDYLQGGVNELRVSYQDTNYRMLYFFREKSRRLLSQKRNLNEIPRGVLIMQKKKAHK